MIFYMQVSVKTYCKLILWFWLGMVKHLQSSQNSKFAMSLQYFKNEVRDEVGFFHASGLKVGFNTLGTKFSYKVILLLLMSMMKHSHNTQRNKFANLCNTSKKKLGMEFIFCMQINIKVSKVSFLMETARHVQSILNRKLVILLQYIKKKVLQLLLRYIVMQNIQMLYGGPVIFVITCFWVVVVKNGSCFWPWL